MSIDDRTLLSSAEDLRNRLAWAAHSSAALVSPRRGEDGIPDPLVLVHVPTSTTGEIRRILLNAEIESETRYLLTGRLGHVSFRLWRVPNVLEVARLFASALVEPPATPGDAAGLSALADAVARQALSGAFGETVEPSASTVETLATLLAESPAVTSLRLVGDSPAAHVKLVTGTLTSTFSSDLELQRLALAMRPPRAVTIHRQPVPVAPGSPAVSSAH